MKQTSGTRQDDAPVSQDMVQHLGPLTDTDASRHLCLCLNQDIFVSRQEETSASDHLVGTMKHLCLYTMLLLCLYSDTMKHLCLSHRQRLDETSMSVSRDTMKHLSLDSICDEICPLTFGSCFLRCLFIFVFSLLWCICIRPPNAMRSLSSLTSLVN